MRMRQVVLVGACLQVLVLSRAVHGGQLSLSSSTGATVDFGNVYVGGTSPAQTVTVTNTGSGAIHGSLSFGSGSASQYNLVSLNNPTSFNLATGTPIATTVDKKVDFAPTSRGAVSDTLSASTTSGTSQTASINVKGTGVAPIENVTVGNKGAAFGNVRIGTTSTTSFTVSNIGDGNTATSGKPGGAGGTNGGTNLSGSFGVSGTDFSSTASSTINLADGKSAKYDVVFSPSAHISETGAALAQFTNGSADGTNQSSSVSTNINGTGVGPLYAATGAGGTAISNSINFGTVTSGSFLTRVFDVRNKSTDSILSGEGGLVRLTLVNVALTGDTSFFQLDPNLVSGATVNIGAILRSRISFLSTGGIATHHATLTITTDEGAALGATGDVFTYDLTGIVNVSIPPQSTPAPEPSTLISALFATASLLGLRNLRSRSSR